LFDAELEGSPGVEKFRCFAQVAAGDSLSMRLEVISLRPSPTRADIGFLRCASEMRNASGTPVMRTIMTLMFARRDAAADALRSYGARTWEHLAQRGNALGCDA
jgi:acyl dehydratase